MAQQDLKEFKEAVREIAILTTNLASPYDRVRCTQWVKKLSQIPDDDLEMARIRNEYIQLLKIQIRHKFIHGIFKIPPPDSNNLAPLPEFLGNNLSKKIPQLPRVGPVAPMLQHKSPDGKAYLAAKQMDGGVFCYMAVTPDTFKTVQSQKQ